jgi:hypothetical protein
MIGFYPPCDDIRLESIGRFFDKTAPINGDQRNNGFKQLPANGKRADLYIK